MQPINYLLSDQSPFEALMGGMEGFQKYDNNKLVLEQNRIANQAAQDKADYLKQAQQEAQTLDYNDPNAIRQFIAKYESTGLTKGMTDYVANLDINERQAMLADTSKGISLLINGDSANAAQFARDKALAYKNAGMESKAAEYEQMAAMMESHPDAALQSLQMNYAVLLPKDAAGNLKELVSAYTPEGKEYNMGGSKKNVYFDKVKNEWVYDDVGDVTVTPDVLEQTSAQRYSSDNSLEGQKYSSDSSRAASQYNADRNYQGTVYSQNAQNSRTEAQLKVEQQKLAFQQQQERIKAQKGQIITGADGFQYVYYGGTRAERLLDAQGQPVKGAVSASANPAATAQREETIRTTRVGTVLDEIEKLLPKATGSLVGTGVDKVAGAFGVSTEGATTTAQLQSLSGQLVALMPKMSGPQSDKDVLMYKQMAGQLDDPTKPIAQRMAALKTIRALNNKYAAMNGGATAGTPSQGQPQASSANINQFFTGK